MSFIRRFESLVFVRELAGREVELRLPDGWDIRKIVPGAADEDYLRQRGVEVENFRKHAVCYAVYMGGEIAGSGWAFLDSRLLKRIGIAGAVYLGSFFVHPECRRKGVYKALLDKMCDDMAGKYAIAVAETVGDNRHSIKGLEAAGFKRAGMLNVVQLMGRVNLVCRYRKE